VQQIREAFPGDAAPRYPILDRDSKYAGEASEMLKNLGSQLIRTAYQSLCQNGIAERWVGSCRRELLDHVIVLNENHLRRLVRDYIRYYHEDRIHDKDTPERRNRVLGASRLASPVGGLRVGHLGAFDVLKFLSQFIKAYPRVRHFQPPVSPASRAPRLREAN
jgi:hypothetical protein